MELRRRQVTLRAILLATFWFAFALANWSVLFPRQRTPVLETLIWMIGLVQLAAIFIAIGTLLGRAKLGAAVGGVVAALAMVAALLRQM